ncbi:MAG: 4-hydroxybutyryl-CoA dehydratase, partial [Dehalococcoidia bacterium]
VFVYKDVERGTRLALLFALWHRLSAVSYRAGLAEYLVGLGKLVAEANGIDEVPHIQKDMVDLIAFAEIQKLCAKMAAYECTKDDGTGIAIPNAIYTNIGKLYSNENYLNVMRSLIDIGGGLIVTAPSGDDYANEELRRDIGKYLRGAIPGEERFKLFLLLREAISLLGGEESVIHIHAEGSIRASLIELYRTYNFDEPKRIIGKLLSQIK